MARPQHFEIPPNEVQRCALLLPALNFISQKSDDPPIALVDIGSAGGLNLLMDKAYIKYSDGIFFGSPNSPLQLHCESQGKKIPSFNDLQIVNRIGIDLNPVIFLDDDERQWNLALIWPDQPARFERVKSALQLLKETTIIFKKGNANHILSKVIAEIPANQMICVMHSFVLNQFSEADRKDFEIVLADLSKIRTIWRISLEWIGTENPELFVERYHLGMKSQVQKLAECHGHGAWIKWTKAASS